MSDTPKPLRINELVVKVASRCNLNCSYCYVYNKGDEGWRKQPHVMSPETVELLLTRVRNHCLRHDVKVFFFTFHGGEPLLCGKDFYVNFVATAKRMLGPEIEPVFNMQTNGTLLDDEWCQLLYSLDINFGISLDGPQAVHDRNRVDHAGRGSYADVRAGIAAALRASAGTKFRNGVLTVVDLDADPIASYEHLKELGVHSADFLLPDTTYDQPPPGSTQGQTLYADWLLKIFDRWFYERPVKIKLRMFELMIARILGSKHKIDSFGPGLNSILFIEADGDISPTVILNVCAPGMTDVGANIATHEFDDVLNLGLVQRYLRTGEQTCGTCAVCPVRSICGGGYLPHRYSSDNGFDNTSVYCGDLMKIITHIRAAVEDELPAAKRPNMLLERLSYEEARGRLVPPPRRPSRRRLPLAV